MSKKLKAIESTIQPNHKEAEIWVSPTNSDGTKEVKYWNDVKDEWSEGSSGSGSAITKVAFIDLQGTSSDHMNYDVCINAYDMSIEVYGDNMNVDLRREDIPSSYSTSELELEAYRLTITGDFALHTIDTAEGMFAFSGADIKQVGKYIKGITCTNIEHQQILPDEQLGNPSINIQRWNQVNNVAVIEMWIKDANTGEQSGKVLFLECAKMKLE